MVLFTKSHSSAYYYLGLGLVVEDKQIINLLKFHTTLSTMHVYKSINAHRYHKQKLELTCDRVSSDATISDMKKDPAGAAHIPVRIREIIRDTLSPSKWDLSTIPSKLPGEGSSVTSMQRELKEAQEKLSQTERDCMELSIKYIAVNEKVRYI